MARIVTIVETLATTYDSTNAKWRLERHIASTYKHFPDASDDKLPRSRGFWIEALAHSSFGPYTPSGSPDRWVSDMQLCVAYRKSTDANIDDDIVNFDYRQISLALVDASKWSRATSDIVSIHAEGDLLAPAVVEDLDGAKVMRITFQMEYTT